MKILIRGFIFFLLIFFSGISRTLSQVTVTNRTNTTPNLAATYTSLANAITALNGITAISGPVIITLNAGNPQTAPVGGYALNFTATTTATNTITIQGSNNTITASNALVAGVYTDAIFKLIGVDYVTIQNFVMQENSLNTNATPATNNMTEWGVALLHSSVTNGAQNNTIQNNTISLNRNYQNTFGIYSNARHSATAVSTAEDVTNATTGPNHGNKIYTNTVSNVNHGIVLVGSSTDANMDQGNEVGGSTAGTGNTVTNWGSSTIANPIFLSASGTIFGIYTNHQKNDRIAFNTIASASITGTTAVTFRGIYKRYSNGLPTGTFTSDILNNSITITNGNTGAGACYGIDNADISAAASSVTMNILNNLIQNVSMPATSANFLGISSTDQVGVLNINGNTIRGTSMLGTGNFTGISNTGSVQTTLNINNNFIGDATGNAVTFTGTTGNSVFGITVPTIANTASLSISGNSFRGFVHSNAAGGNGSHTYISISHAVAGPTTDNINNNTFNNISVKSTGSVTFISRNGAMASAAGATDNCINNSIVGGFSKTQSGGTVSVYVSASGSLSGNSMVQTNNNFSDITLTGTTIMAGWNNSEGSGTLEGPVKAIMFNTFSNWTCGSGAVTVLTVNNGGSNTAVTDNIISNIYANGSTAATAVTGILIGSGNRGTPHSYLNNSITGLFNNATATGAVFGIIGGSANVSNMIIGKNIIGNISSDAAAAVSGIRINNGSITNITRNKIYDLQSKNVGTAAVVSGFEFTSTTANSTINLNNNTIGDLGASTTDGINAVRGINFTSVSGTSTYNIFYNTVYLNASSSGTNFGSSALHLTVSGTAASGNAVVRNNIFINLSTPSGIGFTVAYRRNGTQLSNFNAASNNNIYYAGTPSASRLIFYDGTNSDQTLANYKARVTTRESASFTELTPFLSTNGVSGSFLHIDPAGPTQAESGAVNITGYTDDYDADIRQGNTGYSGTGTAPDIGADELEGTFTETNPPVITYTALTSFTCSSGNQTLSGVNITDVLGVPLAGINRPRIYYRKNSGSWFSQPGTLVSGNASNSNWSFTIVVSDMGGVTGGDVVSYYVIAQDLAVTPNVGANPSTGLVAAGVSSITTHPTNPNTYTLNYTLSGTYTVGSGGNFATLTAAISAYNNACNLTGPVIFELIDNAYQTPAETFPLTINNHAAASAINTLTIRPSATATPVITGNTTTQTINLNGARFIRFDGRQAGLGTTRSMTITGSSTAITINLANDAQNNIVQYCVVRGQRVSTFSGTIVFGLAGSGTGNDNNSISNNLIMEAVGNSNNAIYSSGTSLAKGNDFNTISNNLITNYYNATANSAGIYIASNSSDWAITGNRFYQTAVRQYTAACDQFGIYITSGTGHTIQNNVIGFADENGNGVTAMYGSNAAMAGFPSSYSQAGTAQSTRYYGIYLSLGTSGNISTVDGNTVGGIAFYTGSVSVTGPGVFSGITVESGQVNIGSLSGNIIGSSTGTNSIYVVTANTGAVLYGIRANCITSSSIQNNLIGAWRISGTATSNPANVNFISAAGSACSYLISDNVVGNGVAENLGYGNYFSGGFLSNAGTVSTVVNTTPVFLKGITLNSATSPQSINSNTLQGWTVGYSNHGITGIESAGLLLFGTSPREVTMDQNQIGSPTVPFIHFSINSSSTLYAMRSTVSGTNIRSIQHNDFRQITGSAGARIQDVYMIYLGSSGLGGEEINLSNNSFSSWNNLAVNSLTAIYSTVALTGTSTLKIENNHSSGTTQLDGTGLKWIHVKSLSTDILNIYNNTFNDVNNTSAGMYGIYVESNSNSDITVRKNSLSNWTLGSNPAFGINVFDNSGTVLVDSNEVSSIQSDAAVTGISAANVSFNTATITVDNNNISNLQSNGIAGSVSGIFGQLNSGANTSVLNITQNRIRNIVMNHPSIGSYCRGIHLSDGSATSTFNVRSNSITQLQSLDNASEVTGIYQQPTAAGTHTYSNNIIGDLHANLYAGTDRALTGIYLGGATSASNIYYNTIQLKASGVSSSFSTTCIYAETSTLLNLRNNIISNESTPGASGKVVAFGMNGSSLTNYVATSNNNVYYAGTPSAQNLLFFNNSTGDQTLSAFQTRVSPRDAQSLSIQAQFSSTNSSDPDFLHLASGSNCSLLGAGDNTGILLADDYDGDPRNASFPFITDIGADEATKFSVWTGANGTNWNDAGNWANGIIPNSTESFVAIANPPVNQPVIGVGETFQVGNIYISPEGTLSNRGTLKVYGKQIASFECIDNTLAGTITGSLEYNGSCSQPQTIAGSVFKLNAVKNLTVSNDLSIDPAAGEEVKVSSALNFGAVSGKTLTTGDNVVLLSSATSTAGLGDVTGNSISGKMSVERFINTGTTGGAHPKTWQFLSAPTIGQSIFDAWQEAGSTNPGYGTWITGTGSGFDAASVLPALKYYNPATNLWDGETNTANPVNNGKGYMIFVRGDRTVTTFNGSPVPTILRSKGTVYQPSSPPPTITVGAGQAVSVGNPYPSAIDIAYMRDNGLFNNLNNDVVVWDPLMSGTFGLGGYQTLAAANNYEPTAGGTTYYPSGVPAPVIQSGQAFFVRSSGLAGGVSFNESCKETGSRLVHRMQPRNADRAFFRVTLRNESNEIVDGNAVVFDMAFRPIIDAHDAIKMLNNGENFGLTRGGKWLAVEARGPVQRSDTVFYEFYRLRRQTYTLAFAPKDIREPSLEAWLIDQYLNTETAISLSDSSFVSFSINDQPSSARPDRFYVVFRKKGRVPPTQDVLFSKNEEQPKAAHPSVSVYPNPVVNGCTTLTMQEVKSGTYLLRLYDQLGHELNRQNLVVGQDNKTEQLSFGRQLPSGLYELQISGPGGTFSVRLLVP